jgi:hypothetical protein
MSGQISGEHVTCETVKRCEKLPMSADETVACEAVISRQMPRRAVGKQDSDSETDAIPNGF